MLPTNPIFLSSCDMTVLACKQFPNMHAVFSVNKRCFRDNLHIHLTRLEITSYMVVLAAVYVAVYWGIQPQLNVPDSMAK